MLFNQKQLQKLMDNHPFMLIVGNNPCKKSFKYFLKCIAPTIIVFGIAILLAFI